MVIGQARTHLKKQGLDIVLCIASIVVKQGKRTGSTICAERMEKRSIR